MFDLFLKHDSVTDNLSKLTLKTHLNNSKSASLYKNANVEMSSDHHNQSSSNSHHHFYKLTSTSKEVDIDSQNYSLQNKTQLYVPKNNLNNSNLSYNNANTSKNHLKNVSMNHHQHQKSSNHNEINSYDRVNDWLSSGFQQQNSEPQNASQLKNDLIPNKNNKESGGMKREANESTNCADTIKTTVAYYLPGEDLAYISTYNGKHLTLAQFKHLITKKGNFR